jgi:hypothetical protein
MTRFSAAFSADANLSISGSFADALPLAPLSAPLLPCTARQRSIITQIAGMRMPRKTVVDFVSGAPLYDDEEAPPASRKAMLQLRRDLELLELDLDLI